MSNSVLVLNADFRALSVCSVYKAFLLVYLNKAEMVNKQEEGVIRTIDEEYEAPSVIRLFNYINIPYKGVMLSRQNVFRRDGNKCVYCDATTDLTLDHVVPKSKGGKSSWTNLVTACKSCNSKKGDFDLEEVDMELPYKPYKPSFVLFLRNFSGNVDENWYPYLQVKK